MTKPCQHVFCVGQTINEYIGCVTDNNAPSLLNPQHCLPLAIWVSRTSSLRSGRPLQHPWISCLPICQTTNGVFETMKAPRTPPLSLVTWRPCQSVSVKCNGVEHTCLSFKEHCSLDRCTRYFPRKMTVRRGLGSLTMILIWEIEKGRPDFEM